MVGGFTAVESHGVYIHDTCDPVACLDTSSPSGQIIGIVIGVGYFGQASCLHR